MIHLFFIKRFQLVKDFEYSAYLSNRDKWGNNCIRHNAKRLSKSPCNFIKKEVYNKVSVDKFYVI